MKRCWMSPVALCLVALGLSLSAAAGKPTGTIPESISPSPEHDDLVTLNLENAEITSILKMFAISNRVNIVAGPEVSGTVSVNLYEVPFYEALQAVLGVAGFTYFEKGNAIYVTTERAKADLPKKTHDLQIRAFEIVHADVQTVADTLKQFLSPSGRVVASVDKRIVVQDAPEYMLMASRLIQELDVPRERARVFQIDYVDPDEVIAAVSPLLSPTGIITLSPDAKIVVQDSPDYMERIARIIEEIDAAPRQVLISAKILNVTNNEDLGLGVDLQYSSQAFDTTAPLLGGFTGGVERIATGSNGIFSMIVRGHAQAFIDALSVKNKVETIASPQLLALHGKTSRIQVGDRLGFRVTTTTQTSSLESVEFLEVGTLLEVTPYISKNGLIRMIVHPEVSTGSITPDGLPEERTTEATTEMLVGDGETVLIGGLLNVSRQRTRNQVPILGDIPLLGLLFGRNGWVDVQSELLILITPRIVGPSPNSIMLEAIETVDRIEDDIQAERTDFQRLFKEQ